MHAPYLKLQNVILPVIDISILHRAYTHVVRIPLLELPLRQWLTWDSHHLELQISQQRPHSWRNRGKFWTLAQELPLGERVGDRVHDRLSSVDKCLRGRVWLFTWFVDGDGRGDRNYASVGVLGTEDGVKLICIHIRQNGWSNWIAITNLEQAFWTRLPVEFREERPSERSRDSVARDTSVVFQWSRSGYWRNCWWK